MSASNGTYHHAGIAPTKMWDSRTTTAAQQRVDERDRRHGMDFAQGTLDLRYYSGTSRLLLRQPEQARLELAGSLPLCRSPIPKRARC
jgi:hypothetical protein